MTAFRYPDAPHGRRHGQLGLHRYGKLLADVAKSRRYNTSMQPTAVNHIETTPGVCGGKPRIAGTRIRVEDIVVWHEFQGKSPNEIVADFPQLSLADVHAALTYYFDHREEIQRQMREARDFAATMKASIPSKLPRAAAE